jgi:hypothetical protein
MKIFEGSGVGKRNLVLLRPPSVHDVALKFALTGWGGRYGKEYFFSFVLFLVLSISQGKKKESEFLD